MALPYTVSTTPTLKSTSSYIGKMSNPVLAMVGQTLASNGLFVPSAIGTSHLQSTIPRHGENTASPIYTPPLFLHSPFGGLVPAPLTGSPNLLTLGHATSASSFTVTSNFSFIQYALNNFTHNSTISAFVNDVFNYVYPSQTPAIFTGISFSGSNAYVEGNFTAGVYTIGGAGLTNVIINGNLNIGTITATGSGDITNVIVNGTLTVGSITGSGTVNIILLGTGTITTPSAINQVYSLGTLNGNSGPTSLIGVGSYTPITLGMFNPTTSYPAGSYADFHIMDSATGSPTITQYNMTNTPITYNIAQNIQARLAIQYQVVPGSITELDNVWYILNSIDGMIYSTALSQQTTSTQIVNLGVDTEIYGVDNYLISLVLTYRVANNVFVPYKAGAYLSVYPNGSIGFAVVLNGNGSISTATSPNSSFTIPAVPFYVGDVNVISSNNIEIDEALPVSALGGIDPVVSQGGYLVSQYRKIPTAINFTGTPQIVYSPNSNTFLYGILGGFITSAVDASGNSTVQDGVLQAVNPSRQASIIQVAITYTKVSVTPVIVIDPNYNSAAQILGTNLIFTYADANSIMFSLGTELYTVMVGSPLTLNGTLYTYTATGTAGTLTSVTNGIPTTNVFTFVAPVGATTATVNLIVVFGDVIPNYELTPYSSFTASTGSLTVVKDATGVVDVEGPLFQLPFGTPIYAPGVSQATITSLVQLGVSIVSPDVYQSNVKHPQAYFFPEVILLGQDTLRYTSTQTTVKVPLADGNYNGVIITNGSAPVSDFPFIAGNIQFSLELVQPFQPRSITVTIGPTGQYPSYQAANAALGLDNKARLATSGVNIGIDYTDTGAITPIITGTGTVSYIVDNNDKLELLNLTGTFS